MIRSVVVSAGDQDSIGPSGVDAQSNAWVLWVISPPPESRLVIGCSFMRASPTSFAPSIKC
jgi:hypothetical protein